MSFTQTVFIEADHGLVQMDLPAEKVEVLPNVKWGDVAGFPTIAYWLYKVLEKRIKGDCINYKLGNSLLEEVGACLLGGHGIPAINGLAAYRHMKSKGVFNGTEHSENQLYSWLSEPINLNNKTFKYRFAKQKAKYIHSAIELISKEKPAFTSGKELRDWLLVIKGVGLKTASWVARNWMDADDVAILDIHIYRAGLLAGFFKQEMTIEKHYLELEEQFITLAKSMRVRTSELDAVMWYEMQNSKSVHKLLPQRDINRSTRTRKPSHNNRTNPQQLALV